jgi:syntaxin 18
MPSGASATQAEAIETVYMAALEATTNLKAGNESLVKTIAVNRSTTRYIAVLLLVASACLLFLDWFNS